MQPQRSDRDRKPTGPRVNNRIRVPEIRVISDDGAQLGVMQTRDAMKIAEEKGLDLVEISPNAVPPVCKIVDYGKFKYEQAKNKPKRHSSEVKEIKFRPKTEAHDLDFKIKHIRNFLEEGSRVRLVVAFRGREIVHPNIGAQLLERVAESLADLAVVDTRPNLEGRNMTMVVAPKSKG